MNNEVNRKKTRKIFYQELFANTFGNVDLKAFYSSFFDGLFTFKKDDRYLEKMRKIIKEQEGFFIFVIEKYSPKFKFENMYVENVLPIYIALSEIFYLDEELPIKVSINEAIELAKIYGDDSTKKIANGVLNNVIQDYEILVDEKEKHKEVKYSIFKN